MEWSTSIGLSMLSFVATLITLVTLKTPPENEYKKYFYAEIGIALWIAISVFLIAK